MQKDIILLRGIPGSGKSTLAGSLSENGKHPVFSIDDFFTDERGEYRFEFQNNHLAYKSCEELARKAMQELSPKIFIDNAFTLDWEMEPYFKLAVEYNYRIFVITVENYHGGMNVHNIAEEQIAKMKSKYKLKL